MKKNNEYKKTDGFTLVELMMGVGISVVIVSISYVMWQLFLGSFYHSYEGARNLPAANQTVNAITKEIREMTASETGAYPMELVNDQELAFYVDEDGDGQRERVRYWLNGQELYKGVIEPEGDPVTYPAGNETSKLLISAVQNEGVPVFTYYNDAWPVDTVNNPLAPASRQLETKMIQVHLEVRYSENEDVKPVVVDTAVSLRGIKNNL